MDTATARKLATEYAQKVVGLLQPRYIVLYGSYAQGTQTADSDIDIAVIFDGFDGSWLETSSLLWRLRRHISEDIEPVLLDISADRSGFTQNVLKNGELVYGI